MKPCVLKQNKAEATAAAATAKRRQKALHMEYLVYLGEPPETKLGSDNTTLAVSKYGDNSAVEEAKTKSEAEAVATTSSSY